MTIEVISRQIVYQGHAFSVRRDQVRLPNEIIARLDIIEHPGAVTILPLDADGQILFVRQYRHAAGKELLEMPAGTLDEGEPPKPVPCARYAKRRICCWKNGQLASSISHQVFHRVYVRLFSH